MYLQIHCVSGDRYLSILENFDRSYLDNLPLTEHRNIFYQHDGAPPHRGELINSFLQATFYDQWIANDGPFLWPPRSPDLTVLDFFIWGAIKSKVYETPLTTMDDCMQRVRNAFRNLSQDSIKRATHCELIRRCQKCLEVGGQNFEHLLN